MVFVKVANAGDIKPGSIKGFVIDGKKVAIANVGGKFYALEDRCSHAGSPLSSGLLFGNTVMCVTHGAQVDVTTGNPLAPPAKLPVKKFEVKVNGEDLEVDLAARDLQKV